eukprot:GHVP01023321.1.p1 GENE.GHVP01023321.1~~GHVP01023321.1.p1  ORF type:complete len:551 (+),score=83.88 GHVP01023321.1:414-2066(+)
MQLLNQESKVRREIQLMQTLSHHPNILKIIEIFDTPTDLFLVTEFLEGGELFDLIAKSRGRIQEQEARLYFQQLIAAVDFCHQNMVTHRDLKPENILLDSNRNIKLADFGLGNFFRNGEVLLTPCGSPNYASPEVCGGKPYAGPEVDVWSCGVILYTLLTGSLPFDDDNMGALKNKICRGLYCIPGYLSESSSSLMRRMLDVDPFRRVTLQEVKRHRWFREKLPPYLFSGKWLKPAEDPDLEIIEQMKKLDYEITSSTNTKNLTEATLYPTPLQLGYRLLSIAKPDNTPSVAKYLVQLNQKAKGPKPSKKEPNLDSLVFSTESRRHSKQRKIFEIDLAPFRPMAALNRFGSDTMLVSTQNKTRNLQAPSLASKKSSGSIQPSNTTQGVTTQGSFRMPGPPSSVLSGSRHRGSSRDVIVPLPNWRLVNIFNGISSYEPTSVFLMILTTLKSINYEWFFLNPLKIRCRPIQSKEIPANRILKIPILTIQLFKIEPERQMDDLLVLSVQVFSGATFSAFSESIRVLRKIQEAAQASHYFISPSRNPEVDTPST